MIQQPELGKKIADLRKEKGLTQEELVDKCNINVRTLQRIESGEVTPRTNTIRLIFEALNFSVEKSQNDKGLIQKWLEQFYISFIDLFNLKTNTMKKISVLTLSLFLVVFISSSIFNLGNAQNDAKPDYDEMKNKLSSDTIKTEKVLIAGQFDGWNNDKELIGRDVYCSINHVWIKSSLIRFNKKTNEIRTSCYTAIITEDIVKIIDMKCQPSKRIISECIISGDEFIYKGKIVFSEEESIKAAKIIIPRD